jgi:hypothetical protein
MAIQPASLCTLLYVCFAANNSFAFTTDGSARAVGKSPVSSRREWQQGVEIELPNLEVLFELDSKPLMMQSTRI